MKSTPFYADRYVLAAAASLLAGVLLRHTPPQWHADVQALNEFLSYVLPLVVVGARAEVGSKLALGKKDDADA